MKPTPALTNQELPAGIPRGDSGEAAATACASEGIIIERHGRRCSGSMMQRCPI